LRFGPRRGQKRRKRKESFAKRTNGFAALVRKALKSSGREIIEFCRLFVSIT